MKDERRGALCMSLCQSFLFEKKFEKGGKEIEKLGIGLIINRNYGVGSKLLLFIG